MYVDWHMKRQNALEYNVYHRRLCYATLTLFRNISSRTLA